MAWRQLENDIGSQGYLSPYIMETHLKHRHNSRENFLTKFQAKADFSKGQRTASQFWKAVNFILIANDKFFIIFFFYWSLIFSHRNLPTEKVQVEIHFGSNRCHDWVILWFCGFKKRNSSRIMGNVAKHNEQKLQQHPWNIPVKIRHWNRLFF